MLHCWIWSHKDELEFLADFSEIFVAEQVSYQSHLWIDFWVSGHLINDDAFLQNIRLWQFLRWINLNDSVPLPRWTVDRLNNWRFVRSWGLLLNWKTFLINGKYWFFIYIKHCDWKKGDAWFWGGSQKALKTGIHYFEI